MSSSDPWSCGWRRRRSEARFIADQPDGLHTDADRRRGQLDAAAATAFTAAEGLHGSPRLVVDLSDLGWEVSEKTVAESMRRQGLVARHIKRRNGLTK